MASSRLALLGLAIVVAATTALVAPSAEAHEVVTGWSGLSSDPAVIGRRRQMPYWR